MISNTVYCTGTTAALSWAKQFLREAGVPVTDSPDWNTAHLLLDVPSFRNGDPLLCSRNLDTLLEALPHDITIWGGNLNRSCLDGFHTMDFLQNERYLTENAAITADCTVDIAAPLLSKPWNSQTALIIGWGRIGKILSVKLKALGCSVTVAARSEEDLVRLRSLGYSAIHMTQIPEEAEKYTLIINTVPAAVLSAEETDRCRNSIKIDLASVRGMDGEEVVWARGLPGRCAPERSGKLIADTFLRLWKEEGK